MCFHLDSRCTTWSRRHCMLVRNAHLDVGVKSLGLNTRKLVLWTGVFSMFTYSGARQTLDSYFNVLVGEVMPGSDPFRDFLISRGIFTFGRFLSAGFAYAGVPPRIFLGVFNLGAFFSSLLVVVLPQGSGALSMLLLNVFFQSTMFPTLFAMTLRGQGRHTKFAAAALTMAISGAAAWQGVAYAIGRYYPGVPRYAMVLAVVLFGVLLLWPGLTSLTQVLRKWVDPVWSKRVSREGGPGSTRTTTALANDKGFRSQHEVDSPGV